MIRQALRYGPWYGVDEIILTDYLCGILIRIPDGLENASKKNYRPASQRVEWCHIEGHELRMAVGAVLWTACRKVSETLAAANTEARRN